MVQSVKRPTLGFDSGHDLTVREFQPRVGLWADSTELARDPLSFSLGPSVVCAHTCSHSLSFKINKHVKKVGQRFA